MDEVAGQNMVVEPAGVFAFVAEDVAGERGGVILDDLACFALGIVRVERENGEDGSEDFLFHEGMVRIRQFHDRRLDAEFFRRRVAARDDGFAVTKHGRDAVEMALVDDVAHARFVGEHARDGGFYRFAEWIDEVVRDEDVIGGDAGLSGVGELRKGNSIGDSSEVLDIEDDGRRFSAEFEDVGNEGLCSGFGDMFGGSGASGEEDEIDGFPQEFLRDFSATFDDDEALGIEVCRDFFGEQGTRGWCEFTGFDDGHISGGDGCDEGGEGELEGIVPGADDERDPARLRCDGGERGKAEKGRQASVWAHPRTEVSSDVFGFVDDETNFGEPGFVGVFAEVLAEGVFKLVALVFEHGDEGGELFFAPGEREGGIRIEEFAEVFGDFEHGSPMSGEWGVGSGEWGVGSGEWERIKF